MDADLNKQLCVLRDGMEQVCSDLRRAEQLLRRVRGSAAHMKVCSGLDMAEWGLSRLITLTAGVAAARLS